QSNGGDYISLLPLFKKLYKEEMYLFQNIPDDMERKIEYIDCIGKVLNNPFKQFKTKLDHYINDCDDRAISKQKTESQIYLKEINDAIVKMIRPNTVSESFEVNKVLFSLSNEPEVVEEMLG